MPKMEKDEPDDAGPQDAEHRFEKLKMSQLLRNERLAGMLSSYLDNGLEGEALTEFEALLLENPGLAREVEEMQRVEQALKLIGQDVLDEPVPGYLLDAVRQALKE